MSRRSYLLIKRALDVAISGALLVLLAPVLVAVGALIRLNLGSPVLFRQRRPGRQGVAFTLLKFRTMRDIRLADGCQVPDGERLTPFGCALRSSSLDELPELVNVLRGHMSLVGPRPLLLDYLHLYTPEQARRHEVRPGLTGLAQVSGRNGLDWEERLALDAWYVDHRSLGLDLRIMLRTVLAVLSRRGISQDGCATMTPFTGSVLPEAPRPACAVDRESEAPQRQR